MPAFINTHEHIYSAMARGLSIKGYDPHGFLDILDGLWWTIDRHLTNEQTRQSARVTFIDSIKNGVTTVFDLMQALARSRTACLRLKMRQKNLCKSLSVL